MAGTGVFVHIRVNATRSNQQGWGDTQYAEGLARAIRAHVDCDAALLFRGEIPEARGDNAVLLQIVGPHLEEPVPGLPNLLWMISPPNIAPTGMLGRYHAIFCASERLTGLLKSQDLAAEYLPQATEFLHFHPGRRPEGAVTIPLVFVGGYAPRVDRRLVTEAARAGFGPQIWGPGWHGVVPDRLWRGERLDYDQLAETYASARIVLNSHMPNMAMLGFMSNRSYDALASGAYVVSDLVAGFAMPDLPELVQVRSRDDLIAKLERLLAAPAPDMAARIALHDRLVALRGFDTCARAILAGARRCLQKRQTEPDPVAGRAEIGVAPGLTDPRVSGSDSRVAMLAAAQEILAIARHLEQVSPSALHPPEPARAEGVIHPLMADLRRMQAAALTGRLEGQERSLAQISAAARRISEALDDRGAVLGFPAIPAECDRLMVGVMHNKPLWAHTRAGFEREGGKVSLPLWARRQAPQTEREIGVFLHLYYADLAPFFAERMLHVGVPRRVYVSTDTEAKAERIRSCLPDAEIRVLENRGRDIWPKLFGFADVYDRHDIVLHLHGKKSPHSGKLDQWLEHILDCLTGAPDEVNRILSLFETIPSLGMVVPVTFRAVLGVAHWGANQDIARELAHRMALRDPLPDDSRLRFPVGSMFWARTAAIQPILDLHLKPGHFPPEAGQIDGTLAHAIERMLGVACSAGGYQILPVSGANTRLYAKYQKRLTSNREVRDALASGAFDA